MLTPAAKDALRKTIRSLRDTLPRELRAAAETAYRLSADDADDLPESPRERRARLLAHLDEHVRSAPAADLAKHRAAVRERILERFVLEAAHTWVNRLVLLRHMEALSAGKPRAERLVPIEVLTKGFQSTGYRAFREHAAELCDDAPEGYETLLRLVFDELATDLPGLFGDVGTTRIFPLPAPALRALVEALNDPALDEAWTDDTTLGWVYQYWNDPERERLDAKINDGGKIEPHEIASKTQMFTERYMVEWLLQNSLGLTWLAMCRKHGWKPDAEQVLGALDEHRAEWRRKRDAGEVPLDALMPIHGPLEDRWKYWVPQPIPDDAVAKAPNSIRDLKLLDPACGSGHFLVIAFDLLAALYEEEARHRGESWSKREIAEWIIERNLHGVDIDPRAVQIAAAALYVKWRSYAHDARPSQVNLVAPALHLGRLPSDDPALVELGRSLATEAGVPEEVTTRLVKALAGVDHLGSLLKVDRAIDEALQSLGERRVEATQGDLFRGMPAAQGKLDLTGAKKTVLERIEEFLAKHAAEGELGLRLDGEELAAGLRFLRIVREDTYDVVVGNPPYQGTSKMSDAGYVSKEYPAGKADLYAAFLDRSLTLAREGGVSAMVTMQGWMFLTQFTALRARMLENDVRALADMRWCAFEQMRHATVAMQTIRRGPRSDGVSVAIAPSPREERDESTPALERKRAGLLAQVGRYEFATSAFGAIEGEPIVYWWSGEEWTTYARLPKVGSRSSARNGMSTQDNVRFLRKPWEVASESCVVSSIGARAGFGLAEWAPYIKGAAGAQWFEGLDDLVRWAAFGLEAKVFCAHLYGSHSRAIKNEDLYFRLGVAFTAIGATFSARAHRVASVFGHMGTSVFPDDTPSMLCLLNSSRARNVLASLNPGLHFLTSDVNRLPIFPVENADDIYATLDRAFTEHEAARETSVEFVRPGPSPWAYAQAWAQRAVDRSPGEPLPPYEPTYEPPAPEDFVSFAFGVAMGRFEPDATSADAVGSAPSGVKGPTDTVGSDRSAASRPTDAVGSDRSAVNGPADTVGSDRSAANGPADTVGSDRSAANGPADAVAAHMSRSGARGDARGGGEGSPHGASALPDGILFLSAASDDDGLAHPACAPLHAAWAEHGPALAPRKDLRSYLRLDFFAEHKARYENRPIYFPLSSVQKNFVAWVSIHRWHDGTLNVLLADHLVPAQTRLQGQLADLNRARSEGAKKGDAEKRYREVQRLADELDDFIAKVRALAEAGPPPTDDRCPKREADAKFAMDLDDGVVVNGAALFSLLEPQWKDPKKWWKELATAQGRKDYDWSHLAARYFPSRVEKKCHDDPSLAVAHKCFWRLHPAKAYAWELRLQDEIREGFTIDEPGSDAARERFLAERRQEAQAIVEAERKRRGRKQASSQEEGQGELAAGDERDDEMEQDSAEVTR